MLNDVNSWVSLDYANEYFNNKYGASFWAPLNNNDRESLLITAKNFILQMGYNIADDNTDNAVKKAQCEIAQWYYNSYEAWQKRADLKAAGVKSFRVLSFSETLDKAQIPEYILNLILTYKTNTGNYFGVLNRVNCSTEI